MNTSSSPMQAVRDHWEPMTRGFLLVEPATLVHTPKLAALAMRACTPRVLAHREELMPRLIDLGALDPDEQLIATEHWQAEVSVERPPVVCGWIDSAVDADALVGHIAHYLIGPDVNGKPVFWRYYDPRVFVLALAVFSAEQQRALLGPIQAWRFPWASHVWSVAGPGVESNPTDQPLGWPRSDQWSRINRSDAAEQVRLRLPPLPVQQAAQLPTVLDHLFHISAPYGGPVDIDKPLVDQVWQRLSSDVAGG